MINIKNKKVIPIVIACSIIVALFLFWIIGIIPSFIARISTEKYVGSKYKDMDLKLSEVYWDNNWERYFVSFIDKSGKTYNFKMSQYIPNTIMYDPLDPPG